MSRYSMRGCRIGRENSCSNSSQLLFHCFEHTLKVKFCTFSRESISLILDVCQTWLAQALNTSDRDSQDLNADKNSSKLDQLAS